MSNLKRCPECGVTRFSVLTDATIGFSVDHRGNIERERVLEWGQGLDVNMVICSNGHATEFNHLEATQ